MLPSSQGPPHLLCGILITALGSDFTSQALSPSRLHIHFYSATADSPGRNTHQLCQPTSPGHCAALALLVYRLGPSSSVLRHRCPWRYIFLISVQSSGLCSIFPILDSYLEPHLSQAPPLHHAAPADTLLPFPWGRSSVHCPLAPCDPQGKVHTPWPSIQGPPASHPATLCLHTVSFQPYGTTCHFPDPACASKHQQPCQSPRSSADDTSSAKPASLYWLGKK